MGISLRKKKVQFLTHAAKVSNNISEVAVADAPGKHGQRDADEMVAKVCVNDGESVVLDWEDVDDVQVAWGGHAIVGYIVGKSSWKQAVIACCNSWKVECQIYIDASGWVVVTFESEADRDGVLEKGSYVINGRLFIIKAIPHFFCFDDEKLSKVPLWVHLPRLPLELWNERALSKITSRIGSPIQTDNLTLTRERWSFARVFVEVDIAKDLEYEICIKLPNKKRIVQKVVYENVLNHSKHNDTGAGLVDKWVYRAYENSLVRVEESSMRNHELEGTVLESDYDDSEGSSSDKEEIALAKTVPAVASKKDEMEALLIKLINLYISTYKKDEMAKNSDDGDSGEEEEDDEETLTYNGAVTVKGKVESSGDDESDDGEEKHAAKTIAFENETEASDCDSSENESEEETDEEMTDAKSPKTVIKQAVKPSENNVPQTPVTQATPGSIQPDTLYMGNLPLFKIKRKTIVTFFKEVGAEVYAVRIMREYDGLCKGFGFVEFATPEDAQKGLKLNGKNLWDRPMRLSFARVCG